MGYPTVAYSQVRVVEWVVAGRTILDLDPSPKIQGHGLDIRNWSLPRFVMRTGHRTGAIKLTRAMRHSTLLSPSARAQVTDQPSTLVWWPLMAAISSVMALLGRARREMTVICMVLLFSFGEDVFSNILAYLYTFVNILSMVS